MIYGALRVNLSCKSLASSGLGKGKVQQPAVFDLSLQSLDCCRPSQRARWSHSVGSAATAIDMAAVLAAPAAAAVLSAEQQTCNAELADKLRGKLVLAPLTRGGNLPFRRLCADYGAEATMSEMVFARQLIRGNPIERTRLRRAVNEQLYGFQIATNAIDEGIKASKMAAQAGASWIDLNCGCPIHEATKRGLGAVLLRKPAKLARLVAGIAEGSTLPLTVKVRTGATGSKTNADEVVAALQDAGVAAIIVHGRTMEQRYKKPADWAMVSELAQTSSVPLIGNGDVLTYYEAEWRMKTSGCLAVMTGRGALIKPWIFEEYRTGKELRPTAKERTDIYRRLVMHMKEHFGDDAKGRDKAFRSFLPWHFGFFHRYRPFPEEVFKERSIEGMPLLSMRQNLFSEEIGETLNDLSLLERLLRCESSAAHEHIAAILWDSTTNAEAVTSLETAADSNLLGWEEEARGDSREISVAQG